MVEQDQFDQTQFVSTTVGMQSPQRIEHGDQTAEKQKPTSKRVMVLLIALGVLLLIGIITSVLLISSPGPSQREDPNETPAPTAQSQQNLQEDIETLSEYVRASDPDENNLPFPPVNMELRLRSPEEVR